MRGTFPRHFPLKFSLKKIFFPFYLFFFISLSYASTASRSSPPSRWRWAWNEPAASSSLSSPVPQTGEGGKTPKSGLGKPKNELKIGLFWGEVIQWVGFIWWAWFGDGFGGVGVVLGAVGVALVGGRGFNAVGVVWAQWAWLSHSESSLVVMGVA